MILALARLAAVAAGAVAAAAVARELDKPAPEREWHGDVGGVPYDFRPPTAEKLLRTVWDADNPKVVVPHGFGVGWSVNFARLAALVQPPEQGPPPASPGEITAKPPTD
ncbi:DUF5808 domain-containing protein [Actinoplanes sp. ATCC 53533]|uniref:DUF5808 domain-containing protein n=1 Tax=Actinoplanes sp. ATCC 53533 TaxID=1288362 RepID=UPI0018F29B92|nr:DUF5808 domain-containing protein [Actinoplanes sp. ATCC 53533]